MPAKYIKKWNSKKWNKTYTTKATFKSPYATWFANGVKKGMPCGMIVSSISKKTGKNTAVIFKSLTKAGMCKGQKVNGQWVYWPTMKTKTSKTNAVTCKVKMWQNFADWCICSGTCTPKQFNTKSTTAKTFSAFFKSGFGKTVKAGTTTAKKTRKNRKTNRKRTTITARHHTTRKHRTIWNKTGYTTKVYKFPAYNSRINTNWRRYARAA